MDDATTQYNVQTAIESSEPTSTGGNIDIVAVGKKLKEIYPTGIASDGRSYLDMPDEELGSKYILKNGDKGLVALGMEKKGGDTKEAATLRKELNALQEIKDFKNVQDSWQRASTSPNDGSGDLTLLYSYIKALDPNSVVREGEIDISKATGSVPENVLTAYKRAKEGKLLSDQQRQEYVGEVGRIYNNRAKIAQQIVAFYSGLASDMGADPEKVIGGLGKIETANIPKNVVGNENTGNPLADAITGNPVGEFLLGDSARVAQDVGTAIRGKMSQDNFSKLEGMAKELEDKAYASPDNEEKKLLLQQANQIRGQISSEASNISKSFSSDVEENPLTRALSSAIEIGGTAEVPGFIKSGVLMLPKAGKVAKEVVTKGPFGAVKNLVGSKRDAAARALDEMGVTVDETKIAEKLINYADEAPISMRTAARKYALEGIDAFSNSKATVKETLKKLADANEGAFLQSGQNGRAAGAKIERVVGDAIRDQIRTNPMLKDVDAANKAFELIYKGEKAAKKTLSKYGPVALLGKMVGGF